MQCGRFVAVVAINSPALPEAFGATRNVAPETARVGADVPLRAVAHRADSPA